MRGKYFTNLILIGLFPLLMVAGGAYYMMFVEGPAAAPSAREAGMDENLQSLQAQLSGISQALLVSIQKTYGDIVSLATHPTDEAYQDFVSSHPGVTACFQLAIDGRIEKIIPPGSAVVDAQYADSDEFKNITTRLFTEGRNPYQFYTSRLPYPAFIFTSPTPGKSIVGAVLNLESFFSGLDLKGGEVFLLEAGTGRFFYHSNKEKLSEIFNPNQEAWLSKIQEDLKNKVAGRSIQGTVTAAVYYPLGIGAFGLAHVVPYGAVASSTSRGSGSPQMTLQEILLTPLTLSFCLALAWVLIVGSIRAGTLVKPMQNALRVVERAASGGTMTDADLRAAGTDELGKIVGAANQWARRLEEEKDQRIKALDEEFNRTKTNLNVNIDGKTKEINQAAQQLSHLKGELEQSQQRLNDKVKELEAMKGMSDGLRSQTEQSKGENAKLKAQVSGLEQKQGELQGRLSEMENKLLKTVSASSAIQVSQVRVAAIKTMAEELKTTLGIIKGYVSSALGSTQGGITEKQQEFLGMVINRSARLEKFINDLMDIYLVEIEQESALREEVNLASEIEGLAFNYQPQADIKGLKIQVEAKPGIPKVPVVRRRFTQLWNILYLQMIKDAPRGSVLSIVAEPIGEDVKVTVHDPGLTVKDEHLPKVFDEFYDPKHPASPQLAGTGLKFALIKTILAAHGGGAVAEKGNPGTRLILTFPTKVKKKGEEPPVAAAPRPLPAAAVVVPPVKAPTPTPGPAPGGFDAMLKKPEVPVVPAVRPPVVPPAAPPAVKPAVPPMGMVVPPARPPTPPIGTPAPAPASPAPAPVPPAAPKPVSPLSGGIDALIGKTTIAPIPGTPAAAPPPPPLGTVKPPVPPAAPAVGKVVPTSLKPTTPPPGILDVDNADSFKLDAHAPAAPPTAPKPPAPPPAPSTSGLGTIPPKPATPPPGAPPRPMTPPPGSPPAGGKPIVKDISKEGGADGELID